MSVNETARVITRATARIVKAAQAGAGFDVVDCISEAIEHVAPPRGKREQIATTALAYFARMERQAVAA